MSLWRQVSGGIRRLVNGRAADRDVDDEIQQFIDDEAAELERQGAAPEEARRAARLRAGSALAAREEVRASGWEHILETGAADVRYGLRHLRRQPGFSAVTIATLALGIGCATAMLSVAAPIFVQALPLPAADRIHAIWDRAQDGSRIEMAFGSIVELQERSRSIDAVSASRIWQPTLSGSFEPERLDGLGISADYFRVLGVSPVLGRDFTAAEDRPRGTPAVMLSDGLWRRRFAADPEVIGKQITLDGSGYEVIGVMPSVVEHRLLPAADVWRALQYDRSLPSLQGREWGHHLRMAARLRAGVSLADAEAELNQIARDPVSRFARAPWAAMSRGLTVEPLLYSQTREARPAMLAVLAAVTLLLLIACVNVINLLLGRNAQRRAELAMRTALGAGRGRLIRQLLTETLVLAAAGGLGGLVVAHLIVRALVWLGPRELPQMTMLGIEAPMLAIAFAVTVVVGLVVALLPALSSDEVKAGVPHGSRTVSSHHVMRRSLVVAEVAFALVVLAGASLLFRSLQQLFAVAPGFEDANVLTLQVQIAGPRYRDPAAAHQFYRTALEAVRNVPGVAAAGLTTQLPLSGDSDIYGLRFEATSVEPGAEGGAAFRYAVTPGYFDVMRIPLLRGRVLGEQDRAGAPLAVLISESMARRQFPGVDPVGQRLHIGPTDRPWFTVAGVVGDVRQLSLEADGFDAVYVTAEQWHFADTARWFVIKAHGDAAALSDPIQKAIWSVDKDQPIIRMALMAKWVSSTAGTRRFALILFQAFGLAALLLTAIGIYGVMSGGVTERIREIGVRTALGASRGSILSMVMRHGLWLSMTGVVIGVIAAALASRGLKTLLFGVSPLDPMSYAAVVMVLIGVAMVASWLPAWRASRVDPSVTLRAE
jgi:putative ABC transport system permease protein